MKNSISLIFSFFFCSALPCLAQFDYEWDQFDANQSWHHACDINISEGIIGCISRTKSELFVVSTFDSETGEQLGLYINEDDDFVLSEIVVIEESGNFLILGRKDNQGSLSFITMLLSSDLNVINVDEFSFPDIPNTLTIDVNDYVFWNNSIIVLTQNPIRSTIFQLDLKGNIIVGPTADEYLGLGQTIIHSERDSIFKIIYINSYSLNESFEFIEGSEIYREYFYSGNNYKAINLGDKVLLSTSGLVNQSGLPGNSSLLYLFDGEDNLLSTTGSVIAPGEGGFPFVGRPLAIDQEDNIYHTNQSLGPFGEVFQIAKFDQDLNKIWEYVYSDPLNYLYKFNGILPRPSGGVILYGYRQNTGGEVDPSAYLLCLDENGNMVSSSDELEVVSTLKMEVNTLGDKLSVTLNSACNGTLQFVDTSGRNLGSRQVNGERTLFLDLPSPIPSQIVFITFHPKIVGR